MGRPKTKEEYIKRLNVIYDNFAVKDLTKQEFINQMLELEDPVAVARMRNESHSKIVVSRKKIIT